MTDSKAKKDYQHCLDVGKLRMAISTIEGLMKESSQEAINKVIPELVKLVETALYESGDK